MASTTWHSQFVIPGACVGGNNDISCALERRSCLASGSGDTFLSARQLLEDDSNAAAKDLCVPNENGSSIAANKHILASVNVGRCTGAADGNVCTGSVGTCLDRNAFVPHDASCFLDDDKTQGSPIFNTVFGQCTDASGNNGVCMWDDLDCNTICWQYMASRGSSCQGSPSGKMWLRRRQDWRVFASRRIFLCREQQCV